MSVEIKFAIICWAATLFLGGIVGAVAVWALKHKMPMPFWSGVIIEPEEIIDIPAYNRENCLMWAAYLICMALGGVFSLFSMLINFSMVVAVVIFGTIIMIKLHKKIYGKYKNESSKYRTGF